MKRSLPIYASLLIILTSTFLSAFSSQEVVIARRRAASGGTGTWTAVQYPGSCGGGSNCTCTITTGNTTCAMTVNSTPAAGDLGIVIGYPQGNSSTDGATITSVTNLGATLTLSPGCSAGYNTYQPNCYYALPSAMAGGSGTTLTVNMGGTTSSGNDSRYSYWQFHPSANGNNAALDVDTGLYSASAATNPGPSFTLSGTNPVICQIWQPYGGFTAISSVSSPYNTPLWKPNKIGVSCTPTTTEPATWTPGSSTAAIAGALAISFNPTAMTYDGGFNGFEAGTPGSNVASADLGSSQLATNGGGGYNGCIWTTSITAMTVFDYDASSSMPLLNSVARLSDGSSVSSGAGSQGITYVGLGSGTQLDEAICQMKNTPLGTVTAEIKWNTDQVFGTDCSGTGCNNDCFTIHGYTDFAAVNCYGTTGGLYFNLETAEGNGASHVAYTTSQCPCTLQLTYQIGNGTTAGTHSMTILDSSGNQIGSTQSHAGAVNTDNVQAIYIGKNNTSTITTGRNYREDSLLFCFGCSSLLP